MSSAGASAAAVLVATYSGALGAGSVDREALFSDGQQSLVGKTFSLSFVYDTEVGLRGEDDENVYRSGGTSLDVTDEPPHVNSPISRVTLTVNGISRTYSENVYGSVARTIELYRLRHYYGDNVVGIEGVLFSPTGPAGRSLVDLGEFAGFGTGYFRQGFVEEFSPYSTDLVLSANRLTVAELAAVPEPGVWALMILGFGAVGSVLRHRAPRTSPSAG